MHEKCEGLIRESKFVQALLSKESGNLFRLPSKNTIHTFIDRQVINNLFRSNGMPVVLVGEIDQTGSVECPDASLLLMASAIQTPKNVKGNVIVNNEFWRWMDRL
jgi:hypothetical protein